MILDVLLAVTLLVVAWYALASPDLFRAVILFIVLGLMISLVWVRLGAPDVAMAEAAVGSGLTGALLLSTLSHMRRSKRQDDSKASDEMSEQASEADEQSGRKGADLA